MFIDDEIATLSKKGANIPDFISIGAQFKDFSDTMIKHTNWIHKDIHNTEEIKSDHNNSINDYIDEYDEISEYCWKGPTSYKKSYCPVLSIIKIER